MLLRITKNCKLCYYLINEKLQSEVDMKTVEDYISECLELGRQAARKGNSPAGAVIVRGEKIVSRGEEAVKTKNDITCHAEIEAIRRAVTELKTNDLSDCILYSSHEPCIMCAYAIRFYKIGKVVYQHKASWLGGASSSMPLLTTTEVPPHWSAPPMIVHPDADSNSSVPCVS